jgi:AcrR family transcriptional regulator
LIDAAVRLSDEGRSPTIPEVAEEALVSTATAYRYFSSPHELMLEVATRQVQPEITRALAEMPGDPERRIDQMVDTIARFQLRNEPVWRASLKESLVRWQEQSKLPDDDRLPVRGSHRMDALDAAMAPLRNRMAPEGYRRLLMATMLVSGVEAMVSARDAAGLSADEAREVMRWSARALYAQAVREDGGTVGCGTD